MNTLKYWQDNDTKLDWINFELSELQNLPLSTTIGAFLTADIAGSKSCKNWIDTIYLASVHPNFLVESSANACFITVTQYGVRIVNEYTDDVTELGLADMQIILEKWLEFLENGGPIEFSWETPVKKYIYDESIDAYVPAPE